MNIRLMKEQDKLELRKIWDEFYSKEFPFSSFNNFVSAFTVENEGKIITAGGIRPIAESVIITDKNFSVKERRAALYIMLQAQLYAAGNHRFEHLHAFIQDESWQLCLERIGFRESKGKCLILE